MKETDRQTDTYRQAGRQIDRDRERKKERKRKIEKERKRRQEKDVKTNKQMKWTEIINRHSTFILCGLVKQI